MKTLYVQIFSEEDGRILCAQNREGGIPELKPKFIKTLRFDGETDEELAIKVLTNCLGVIDMSENPVNFGERSRRLAGVIKGCG